MHRVGMKDLLAASATALLTCFAIGCEADSVDQPQCTEQCDELPATEPLLSCWVVPSDTEDAFFRRDELHCRYAPASSKLDLASVAVNVETADGNVEGLFLREEDAESDVFVMAVRDGGFPLTVHVDAVLNFSDVNESVIGIDAVRQTRQTFAIADVSSATAEQPLEAELPFDVLDLRFFNRHDGEARIEFGHDVVIGDEAVPVDEVHQIIDFGLRSDVSVVTTAGAESLGVTVGLQEAGFGGGEVARYDSVLSGPGNYEISATEMRLFEPESEQPLGSLIAFCEVVKNTIPAPEDCEENCEPIVKHALWCAGIGMPGTSEPRTLTITGSGSEEFAVETELLATGDILVDVPSEALPLTLEVRTPLADTISGLSGLRERVHTQVATLGAGDPLLSFHLPFDLWHIELEVDEELLFAQLTLDERAIELGYGWDEQFAVRAQEDGSLSASPSNSVELVVAVPAQAVSLSANLRRIDPQGTVMNTEVVVGPGLHRATASGLHSEP